MSHTFQELVDFFHFATSASSLDMKKTFIKKRDSLNEQNFKAILFGCAWGGNVEGFALTLMQMEKYNIAVEQTEKNQAFYLAFAHHPDFAKTLDLNYQCSQSLINDYESKSSEISENGYQEVLGFLMDGEELDEWVNYLGEAKRYFTINIHEICAQSQKMDLLDYLIENQKINTNLLNEIFFSATFAENKDVITKLITTPVTNDLLNWKKITLFLTNDELKEKKQVIQELCSELNAQYLEKTLPQKERVTTKHKI